MEPIAGVPNALPSIPPAAGRSSAAAERFDRPAQPLALAKAPTQQHLGSAGRPAATFLAHLIATSAQMPQTRMRRRAEPAMAAATYAGAGGTGGGATGTLCARHI
jgi:hypothetical protein